MALKNPSGFRRQPDGVYAKKGNYLVDAANHFEAEGYKGHLVWPGKITNWACYTMKLSHPDKGRVEVIFYWLRNETRIKYLKPGQRSEF